MISIVLPTYNRAHIIKRAIDSVTAQSYSNYELIIVDDGSSDGTQKLIESMNIPKCTFIRLDNNSGQANARNEGIRNASGEYIAFIDSDDEWFSDKNEKQLSFLLKNNADLVYSDALVRVGTREEYIARSPKVITQTLINEQFNDYQGRNVFVPSVMVKHSILYPDNLFDTSLPALEDLEFFTRIALDHNLIRFPNPLFIYHYDSPDSISLQSFKITHGRMELLNRFQNEIKMYPNFISHQYQIISVINSVDKNYKLALQFGIKSILSYPLRIQAWLTIPYLFFGSFFRPLLNVFANIRKR